jgi:NAD(P)-dependent dehydrogenase (short-subunit alcohol dehydrogenase family)
VTERAGDWPGEPVWLVTGATGGLGRALTVQLLAAGGRVVATARSIEPLADLTSGHPSRLLAVAADVTDPGAAAVVAAAGMQRFGRIDVLVNNAGSGLFGAVEELSDEEILGQLDVNLLGPWRFIRAVLPGMRARGDGLIVTVSSVAGFVAHPGNGAYNASKFAVNGMTEALAGEVSDSGVRVLLVEPGPFRTEFLRSSAGPGRRVPGYPDYAGSTRARAGRQLSDPVRMAGQILQCAASAAAAPARSSPFRLVLGPDAWQAIQARLARMAQELETSREAAWSTVREGPEQLLT